MAKLRESPLEARRRATELAESADGLTGRILDVTTPLYRTNAEGRPFSEGTGVFLQLGGIRFLLTAAHVLANIAEGGMKAEAGGVLEPIGGEITRLFSTGARTDDDDMMDVRIIRLRGAEWDSAPSRQFLSWDELDHDPHPLKRHTFALVGYPETLQRQPLIPTEGGAEVRALAYRVTGLECPSEAYAALGADYRLSLLMGFDKRRTWAPTGMVTAPDLYGASGCGLWRFGRSIRQATTPPKLSAIGIRWERGRIKHIRGTRIHPVLVAIGERYSDARAAIDVLRAG